MSGRGGDERNNHRREEEDAPLSNDAEQGSDDDYKSNSSNGSQDTESDRESVRFTLVKLNITMTREKDFGNKGYEVYGTETSLLDHVKRYRPNWISIVPTSSIVTNVPENQPTGLTDLDNLLSTLMSS